ncbi:MAG TPA: DUF2071 domain-containing protein [Ilumatobacteraceae bacterium]|jgi:hypothetical protein
MPSPRAVHKVPPLIHQRWRDVSFLHWPVPSDEIQALLPPGLTVDVAEGSGWVSLTPFSTTCAFMGVPLPGPLRFPETNVRTYVRGPDGRDGLWFLSLDVTNRSNAVLGRAIQLPYYTARMHVDANDDVHYTGARTAAARYDVVVRPTDEMAVSPLDVFLTGRWSAYVAARGRLVRFDVEHEPWPLRRAEVIRVDESMLEAGGVRRLGQIPLAHFAAGVNANLAPARLMDGTVTGPERSNRRRRSSATLLR